MHTSYIIPVLKGPHHAPHLCEHTSQPMSHSRETQLHLHIFYAGELQSRVLGHSPWALLWTMVAMIEPFKMHMRKEACGCQQTTLLFLIYPNFTDC